MHYFVTGATGFIGKRLVKKLLSKKENTVYFLVRKQSLDKVAALLKYWDVSKTRAIAIGGDLRDPLLGVASDDVKRLTKNIQHFFHFAAVYDLNADAEDQIAVNVDGTRHTVAFANAIEAQCFHHVSSIAAAGLYEGIFREDMFDEAENLDHPYFSTKHKAEKIVRNESTIPFRVYRPGMVIGDSKTGEADKVDGPYYFFKLIQRVRQLLPPWMPMIGLEGGRLNIVPVDYVVNAMDYLAHLPKLDGQCFHLTDPEPMRVGDVLNTFARAAHAPGMSLRINAALLDFIPESIKKGMISLTPVRRIKNVILRDLDLPDDIMRFVNYPTRFDNRNATAALNGSGISCPPLESYADKIWDYWERHLDPALLIDRSLHGQVEGKVVLVTGGSSGIGLAAAHKLAEAGAITIICGRSEDKLLAAKRDINARGFDVISYVVNLADMEDCDRFMKQLLADQGGVDILINNAGRSIRRGIESSYDRFHDFERLMQLNYFGALRLTIGLLPKMIEKKQGQIINISSIGVLTNAPRFSGYVASKAALDAWSRCAASEFSDVGIKFTTINMPLVRTPMIAPTKIYKNVPTLAPEDAADLIVQAIVYKPVRISTRLGVLGEVVHALVPRVAQVIMNTSFRMFPDTDVPHVGAPEKKTQLMNADQIILQKLLHGLHF
ncbi:MAG: SDR family oxidoreductase [Undibacterium sp.]|nr:SDR family oxidoreductase [Undibacterium sp.]